MVMERAEYGKLFLVPDHYRPPDDLGIFNDTKYPNNNSRDYRKRSCSKTFKHKEFFESLSVNQEGLAILATNGVNGRMWNGSVWGYEDLRDVKETSSCFKLHCDSPVTKLQFLQEKIILIAQMNGSLNLWSTKSEARDASGYCLFMIGEKTGHSGVIFGLDVLHPQKTKVVTGSNDCSLKIWDTGAADLTCLLSIRNAHSDDITSVSSSPSLDGMFASCSRDKSALIWDYRLPRPAKALFENHSVAFSTISWCEDNEWKGHISLGDDSGYIYQVDPRMPRILSSCSKIFDKPIRKISFCGNKNVIIGNTNAVRVYDCQNTLLYKNKDTQNYIRDVHWIDNHLFCTVSWDKQLLHHSLLIK